MILTLSNLKTFNNKNTKTEFSNILSSSVNELNSELVRKNGYTIERRPRLLKYLFVTDILSNYSQENLLDMNLDLMNSSDLFTKVL
jgi:hypothetical protein